MIIFRGLSAARAIRVNHIGRNVSGRVCCRFSGDLWFSVDVNWLAIELLCVCVFWLLIKRSLRKCGDAVSYDYCINRTKHFFCCDIFRMKSKCF